MTTNGEAGGEVLEDIAAVITRRFDAISAKFAAGTDADEILPFMNWPDAVVVSPSYPNQFNGSAELLPGAREYVIAMGRDVTFEITAPVLAGGDTATVVARITCRHEDRDDDVSYALYVWNRRGGEWKVAREAVVPATSE